MRRYYTLESATKYISKTRPFPFIIAHECNEVYTNDRGEELVRNREFYAFDDVDHYYNMRDRYPYSHEVVFSRINGQPQQGRIVFDFDVEESYLGSAEEFVPIHPDFEQHIEQCIRKTLEEYYVNVDLNKILFIWQHTMHARKYSAHLTVKNAYLCNDWVTQLQTFYGLFRVECSKSGLFSYIPLDKLFDGQICRTNATFRMCGNRKIGGNPLTLVDNTYTFYDTLIQLHRPIDKKEIYIKEAQLKIDTVFAMGEKDKTISQLPQLRKAMEPIRKHIIDDEVTEAALPLLKPHLTNFIVDGISNGIIRLQRVCGGNCIVKPDVIHDRDSSYAIVSPSGFVSIGCFRGCVSAEQRKTVLIGRISINTVQRKIASDSDDDETIYSDEEEPIIEDTMEEEIVEEDLHKQIAIIKKQKRLLEEEQSPQKKVAHEKRTHKKMDLLNQLHLVAPLSLLPNSR